MQRKSKHLSKLLVMIGGFLILMGIIMLGIAIFSLFGYLKVGILLERRYLLIFALGIVAVGLFGALSAVIIARWSD